MSCTCRSMKEVPTSRSAVDSLTIQNHTSTSLSLMSTCSSLPLSTYGCFMLTFSNTKTFDCWMPFYDNGGTIDLKIKFRPTPVLKKHKSGIWILRVVLIISKTLWVLPVNRPILVSPWKNVFVFVLSPSNGYSRFLHKFFARKNAEHLVSNNASRWRQFVAKFTVQTPLSVFQLFARRWRWLRVGALHVLLLCRQLLWSLTRRAYRLVS